MKYKFNDILTTEVYENTRIMFVFGKYNLFNNMVADELKSICTESQVIGSIPIDSTLSEEFGFDKDDNAEDSAGGTSVDFNTFMDVIGVQSINGKWFCKVELDTLKGKQLDKLKKYMKEPSDNGILVINSTDWMIYKDWLRNRIIAGSNSVNCFELTFPNRDTLKEFIKLLFEDQGLEIESSGAEYFMLKMNQSYDEYMDVINDIRLRHEGSELSTIELKKYMRGIQHYVLDNFVNALTKPVSSEKTNSKKILRIMSTLEEEMGAKNLVYRTDKIVQECIQYRMLINAGIVPIGINYFYGEVIDLLGGKDGPYGKVKEFTFRKKAALASKTSLKDWELMHMILEKPLKNVMDSDDVQEFKCKKALFEVCTRSVLTESRIKNIIGTENVLADQVKFVDDIKLRG